MKKTKYYAVSKGRESFPDIYESWQECRNNIHQVPGAQYKSFGSKEAAIAYLAGKEGLRIEEFLSLYPHLSEGLEQEILQFSKDIIYNEPVETQLDVYVDGSFQEGINAYGFGCVLVKDNEVLEQLSGYGDKPDAVTLRNVSGEMLAAIEGIRRSYALGYRSITLHYDYQGIESWATGEWKRNNIHTKAYHDYMQNVLKKMSIEFVKVEAHSGHCWNDLADQLAKKGVSSAKDGTD